MPSTPTQHLIFWPAITAFLLVSLRCWIWLIPQWWQGKTVLPQEDYAPKPMGVIDVLLALAIMTSFAFVALKLFLNSNDLQELNLAELSLASRREYQWYSSAGLIVAVILTIGLLAIRYGLRAQNFGFRWKQFSYDIAVGFVAFFAAAPFIYGLNMLVSLLQKPYHPLIDMVHKDPTPYSFLTVAFAAVILAPLAEEFFYRLIFQGWIEKAVRLRHSQDSTTSAALLLGGSVENESSKPIPPLRGAAAWAPTVASAMVFAMLHLGQGAAPIPLFFLALLFGFLFQRTGRITPCVVVHFLLNGFSTLALLLEVLTKPDIIARAVSMVN